MPRSNYRILPSSHLRIPLLVSGFTFSSSCQAAVIQMTPGKDGDFSSSVHPHEKNSHPGLIRQVPNLKDMVQ